LGAYVELFQSARAVSWFDSDKAPGTILMVPGAFLFAGSGHKHEIIRREQRKRGLLIKTLFQTGACVGVCEH
jgi:hypothetical protein